MRRKAASARSKPSVSPSWYSDGASESAASSAFLNWLSSQARYSLIRLSICVLSVSANVLILSFRHQRFAVCSAQTDLVSLDVDGQFCALTVGVGDALPVAVLKP